MENNQEIPKPFGKLFNSIDLMSENHLEGILHTMDKESATFILVQAVKFAYNQGIYSIGETEVISKSIRTLSNKLEEN